MNNGIWQRREYGGFEPIPSEEWICNDPQHSPPTHLFIPQGQQYRHICPSCGGQQVLRAPRIVFGSGAFHV